MAASHPCEACRGASTSTSPSSPSTADKKAQSSATTRKSPIRGPVGRIDHAAGQRGDGHHYQVPHPTDAVLDTGCDFWRKSLPQRIRQGFLDRCLGILADKCRHRLATGGCENQSLSGQFLPIFRRRNDVNLSPFFKSDECGSERLTMVAFFQSG